MSCRVSRSSRQVSLCALSAQPITLCSMMGDKMKERWHEIWATFSVKDHCYPGAFIAEALLYDHLLIPVVPTRRDGLSHDEADAEWERWKNNGWNPARSNQMVAILGNRATAIPWIDDLKKEWWHGMNPTSETIGTALCEEVKKAQINGYFMTGTVLEKFAPRMAKTVVAATNYRSMEDLHHSTSIRRRVSPERPLTLGTALAVIGCELLVPNNPDQDDFQFLSEAVEVGSDRKYREKRNSLYQWLQGFVDEENLTDMRSINRAVSDLADLVSDLNVATGKQKVWKGFKQFFSFLKVCEKIASVAEPAGAKVAGATIAIGDFVLDSFKPDLPIDSALPVAALILDMQTKLGLTDKSARPNKGG